MIGVLQGLKYTTEINYRRIIVLEVEIDDEIFSLINLYNPNTEAESFLWILTKMFFSKETLFFNSNLEASGVNSTLKKMSISKNYTTCLKHNLVDIWRIVILFQNVVPLEKIIFQGTYKGV